MKTPAQLLYDHVNRLYQSYLESSESEQRQTCGIPFFYCSKPEPLAEIPEDLSGIHEYFKTLVDTDADLSGCADDLVLYCQSLLEKVDVVKQNAQGVYESEAVVSSLHQHIMVFLNSVQSLHLSAEPPLVPELVVPLEAREPSGVGQNSESLFLVPSLEADLQVVVSASAGDQVLEALKGFHEILKRSPTEPMAVNIIEECESALLVASETLKGDSKVCFPDQLMRGLAEDFNAAVDTIDSAIKIIMKKRYTDSSKAKSKYKTFTSHPTKGEPTGHLPVYGHWGVRNNIFRIFLAMLPTLQAQCSCFNEASEGLQKLTASIGKLVEDIKSLILKSEVHFKGSWGKFPSEKKYRIHRASAWNMLVQGFSPKMQLTEYNEYLDSKPDFRRAFAADYKDFAKRMRKLAGSDHLDSFFSAATASVASSVSGSEGVASSVDDVTEASPLLSVVPTA